MILPTPLLQTIELLYLEAHSDSGIIQLSAVGVRDVSLQIEVKMDNCPPGYIHNSNNMRCVCYSNIKDHSNGIERCDDSEFQVYVKHGYWVGYSETV